MTKVTTRITANHSHFSAPDNSSIPVQCLRCPINQPSSVFRAVWGRFHSGLQFQPKLPSSFRAAARHQRSVMWLQAGSLLVWKELELSNYRGEALVRLLLLSGSSSKWITPRGARWSVRQEKVMCWCIKWPTWLGELCCIIAGICGMQLHDWDWD